MIYRVTGKICAVISPILAAFALSSFSIVTQATIINLGNSKTTALSLVTMGQSTEIGKAGPKNSFGETVARFFDSIKQKPTDANAADTLFAIASVETFYPIIDKNKTSVQFESDVYARAGWDSHSNWESTEPAGWPRNTFGPGYSALSSVTFTQAFTLQKNDGEVAPILSVKALTDKSIGTGRFLFDTLGDDFVNGVGYVGLKLNETLGASLVDWSSPLEFKLQDKALTSASEFLMKTFLPKLSNPASNQDLISSGISLLGELINISGNPSVEQGAAISVETRLKDTRKLTLQYDKQYDLTYSMVLSVSQWDGMWGEFSRDGNGTPIRFRPSISVPEPSTVFLGLLVGMVLAVGKARVGKMGIRVGKE